MSSSGTDVESVTSKTVEEKIDSLICENCDSHDELCDILSGVNESLAGLLPMVRELVVLTEATNKCVQNMSQTVVSKACIARKTDKHILIKGGKENYGRIIGKAGHTIHSLQDYYGVSIDVPKPDHVLDVICIDYFPKNKYYADCAASYIVKILNNEYEGDEYNE